jgi:hypothetical protein
MLQANIPFMICYYPFTKVAYHLLETYIYIPFLPDTHQPTEQSHSTESHQDFTKANPHTRKPSHEKFFPIRNKVFTAKCKGKKRLRCGTSTKATGFLVPGRASSTNHSENGLSLSFHRIGVYASKVLELVCVQRMSQHGRSVQNLCIFIAL